jgi:hypothetical protein
MTTRQLPTTEQVRLAMDLVLREAAKTGHRPTITAVERRLDIAHPTFYRNFSELIDWFKQQVRDLKPARQDAPAATRTDPNAQMARLRRENEDLRTLTKLYAEAIRQLTLDYAQLESKLNALAGVTPLDAWREQH